MNTFTRKIKSKGYKLNEFIKLVGIVLSTYREYEKPTHNQHQWLINEIERLERKT